MTDDKKKEVARRSMVGAPPSARPSRTSRQPATPRQTPSRKRSLRDEEDPADDHSENENTENDSEHSETEEVVKETPKPKKKKKRFLTDYTIKRKAREAARAKAAELRRRQIEAGIIDEEEPEPTPEPEPEPEEEEPEPEAKPAEVRRYTPFQLLCDHLLRKLMAKDPEEYFAFPVTQSMAPDYHEVITNPMDFSAMRQKVEDDVYQTVPEMRSDGELIVSNALAYNHPNTVYHLAATRLSHIVRFYFSEQYLRYAFHMMPFAREIPLERVGLTPLAPEPKKHENKRAQAICDNLNGKELLSRVPSPLSTRLTTTVPALKDSRLAFLDNRDGATVLNVIGEPVCPERTERKVKLVDLIGPLEEGTPGLFAPIETRPSQAAVSYLDYGPFSSFAPHFDSTWAGLDKVESDLLLRTYGDRVNCADAISLRNMVQNCGEHFMQVVDELLDTLTDGEHSKTIEQLEKKEKMPPSVLDAELPSLLDDIETIENLGFDASFVSEIRERIGAQPDESTQAQLDAQGQALLDIASLQQHRLSQPPPLTLSKAPGAGPQEILLTEKVVAQIVETVQTYAPPGELISAPAVHNAIGIEDPEADTSILSEFFVM